MLLKADSLSVTGCQSELVESLVEDAY